MAGQRWLGGAAWLLDMGQGNSLLAYNVYDLRFHDVGPDSVGQAVRRRMVDLILR